MSEAARIDLVDRAPLTEKQQNVYESIMQYQRVNGYAPTIREICKMVGVASTSSVYAHLKILEELLQFTLDDGTGTDRTILSGIHSFYEPEELVGKTLIAITNLPPRAMMGIDSCGMLLSAIHEEEGEEKLHLLMVDDHIPAGAKLY